MTQLTCQQRIQLLASHLSPQHDYLGEINERILAKWVTHELGDFNVLDTYITPTKGIRTRAIATPHILHIASANTPHSALQSLLRGLIVGSKNTIKLSNRSAKTATYIQTFIESLPTPLQQLCSTTKELTNSTLASASTIIVFGSDTTVESIRAQLSPQQKFIPHGRKLSIALIDRPSPEAAELAAHDICLYDQQGCLSTHAIYVRENSKAFTKLLADAMAEFQKNKPRRPLDNSESGAISNARSSATYLAANDPNNHAILTSGEDNTAWTVIYKSNPTLTPSTLNRLAYIHPWPGSSECIGSELHYLSTLALHPFSESHIKLSLGEFHTPPLRICPLGKSQSPHLLWHHDGTAPLASLVTWHDIHD